MIKLELELRSIAGYREYIMDVFEEMKLLGGEVTLDKFTRLVRSTAQKLYPNNTDARHKMCGDLFESLCEMFFKLTTTNPTYGVTSYTPTSDMDDYGVDGVGYNVLGDAIVVQVKYRANRLNLIGYGELAKTVTSGIIQRKLDLTKSNTVFLFTNSNGVNHHASHVLSDQLVVVGYGRIRLVVDGNIAFWSTCCDAMFKYFTN